MTIQINGWQAPQAFLDQLEEAFDERALEVSKKILELAGTRDRQHQIILARMALVLHNRGKKVDDILNNLGTPTHRAQPAAESATPVTVTNRPSMADELRQRRASRFSPSEPEAPPPPDDGRRASAVPVKPDTHTAARPGTWRPAPRYTRLGPEPSRRSTARPVSTSPRRRGKFRWQTWVIVGASVVTVLLAGGLFAWESIVGGPTSESPVQPQAESPSAEQPEAAEPPKFIVTEAETVDLKSADWYGPTQILLVLAALSIPLLGYLDGKERLQIGDAVFAIVGATANYLVMWAPIMAFNITLFGMDQRGVAILVSFVIIAVVTVKALTGNRDTSSLGVYFGLLALGAAIFGNMGAMQVAFNVPSQPLYAIQDLSAAILAKQGELIKFTLLIYTILVVAIVNYIIDIVAPVDGDLRWEAIISAVIVVVAFYLASIKLQPALSLIVAVAASILTAMILRRTGERLATRATGENPLSQVVQRVFEYTAWDGVALGTILVVILRLACVAVA
ncbi:hypothetical protein KKB64_02300 [Patescibacteria group bacterium]|nr:hypothetical protein [Patescibacteria group bacterium]MBU1472600.1 hypothetical protein [Patescibacteria group bacterium]MBU2459851.1 hypothetical protein [Patescibacteria group bacterium]MBU2544088.1 hypothetical protein [Patescibacteria group bacterium]